MPEFPLWAVDSFRTKNASGQDRQASPRDLGLFVIFAFFAIEKE
jgi:hypothetical protein